MILKDIISLKNQTNFNVVEENRGIFAAKIQNEQICNNN